jgi:hypothetical protein
VSFAKDRVTIEARPFKSINIMQARELYGTLLGLEAHVLSS